MLLTEGVEPGGPSESEDVDFAILWGGQESAMAKLAASEAATAISHQVSTEPLGIALSPVWGTAPS